LKLPCSIAVLVLGLAAIAANSPANEFVFETRFVRYVITEDESARVESAYSLNYARLKQIKGKYDPENFFHLNQNIKP
jgi:hypothetical protein